MLFTALSFGKVSKLKENLLMKKENGYIRFEGEKDAAFDFCEGYKAFLNTAKTEREFVTETVKAAQAQGFKPLGSAPLKKGDKVYSVNRGKGILLAVIGSEPIESGLSIVGAHIDSPRLDLKQNPLYEDSDIAFLKTHYYGGIKKYQWTAIPLAMHGTVILADGTSRQIAIGDEGDDITFTISDILPHLADDQYKKSLKEAIEGENLNIIVGSVPVRDDEKNSVKLAVLQYLNDKYSMTEEDFISAEIELVPAFSLKDLGFDRGLIAGPAQDDRVCSYAALKAIFDIKNPSRTAVCLLVDKEEIGSMGNTGMESRFFENTVLEIAALMGEITPLTLARVLSASQCLSADVNAGFDPNFASPYEKNNSAYLSYGVSVTKYTGARGKAGSSDASAEFVGEIRRLFNENGVLWQTGELGKVDAGGGGTIAQYVANLNIDTIDCGTPLLSMHSPFEVSSKMDVYMTYKGYKVFFER